jgi:hypothetical protein
MADRFPITPESLVRETLQAVTWLKEWNELTPGWRAIRTSYLAQIEAKLQTLLALLTAPPTPAVVREMRPLVQALAAELGRLGWSSETAPPGDCCLDAFPTNEAGIVAIESPSESTTCFYGVPLLAILRGLPDDITWNDVWQAIQPAVVND